MQSLLTPRQNRGLHFGKSENVFQYDFPANADNLGVGQSTVIRFSQKLGYKNYRNMLLDLSGPMRARTI